MRSGAGGKGGGVRAGGLRSALSGGKIEGMGSVLEEGVVEGRKGGWENVSRAQRGLGGCLQGKGWEDVCRSLSGAEVPTKIVKEGGERSSCRQPHP